MAMLAISFSAQATPGGGAVPVDPAEFRIQTMPPNVFDLEALLPPNAGGVWISSCALRNGLE